MVFLMTKPALKGQGSVASGPALPSGKPQMAETQLWFEQFLSESQSNGNSLAQQRGATGVPLAKILDCCWWRGDLPQEPGGGQPTVLHWAFRGGGH